MDTTLLGLAKACDAYCICTLQLMGPQLAVGGLFSPRSKTPGAHLCKTETVRRSDTPRWKTGQAQFRHRLDVNSVACIEISLMASRLMGSELLGRAHIELAALLSEAKTDRWYPIKSKTNQETGNVRVQTAGGRSGGRSDKAYSAESPMHSQRGQPMAHPRDSLMYLQHDPPPGTPGGIPIPGQPGQFTVSRPPQRPARPARIDIAPSRIDIAPSRIPPPPDTPSRIPPAPDFPANQSPGGRGPSAESPHQNTVGGAFNPYGGGSNAPVAASAAFQYKCGDMVGKGAFGKVFQALNLNSGELMAVKCVELCNVSDDDMEEIRNEVQLLRSLKHRHVVQYIATHQMEGSLNILMEFCPGQSNISQVCLTFKSPLYSQKSVLYPSNLSNSLSKVRFTLKNPLYSQKSDRLSKVCFIPFKSLEFTLKSPLYSQKSALQPCDVVNFIAV